MAVIATSLASTTDTHSMHSADAEPLRQLVRVLLVKPYQVVHGSVAESPPMGLLCLSASLKEAFADKVEVKVLDMKLYRQHPSEIVKELKSFDADVVGVSALNCEASASREIAAIVKRAKPSALTVLGGPYAHKRGEEILKSSEYDWVIGGPGDRNLPQALRRFFNQHELGTDIPGLSYKKEDGSIHATNSQDMIENLDSLPMPDWQHIDFDTYSRRITMMMMQKGKRYGLLFTSRGCPYLCNYCHDIFSKNFKFQSADRVLQEIELLYERHGVTEFHIVDDIFNLHKPRLKKIMHEVHRRWPGKIQFAFPNGVRADIIDEDVLDDLKLGGTYAMSVAIETATPRLQELIEKHLDIEKTHWVIEQADKRGIMVNGFFMLGFPTETPEELQATIHFALSSKLTTAGFFTVIPQPGTPMYQLAEREDAETLKQCVIDDEEGKLAYRGDRGGSSWYERTYSFPLSDFVHQTMLRFYFSPSRIWRMLCRVPLLSLAQTGSHVIYTLIETKIKSALFAFKTVFSK